MTSDGCTHWLDGWPTWLGGTGEEWRHCCVIHDMAPNSIETNFNLFTCVWHQSPLMAVLMLAGLSTLGWLYVWGKKIGRKRK